MRPRPLLACAAALALVACTGKPAAKPSPSPSGTGSPSPRATAVAVAGVNVRPAAERLPSFRAVKVAEANYPAGLAVAPDGRVFYSELYGGRIRVIGRDGRVEAEPWFDVNARYRIAWKQFFHGGLSGLAFDPGFASNGYVYAVAQVPDPKTELPAKTMILRFREQAGRGTDPTVLLEIPAGKFDNVYSLVFGPDGMLYVPSGQSRSRPKDVNRLDDLLGKVLRLTRDGKAPGDNPFGDRAPMAWATGIRNAFDIAFDPATGFAVAGENGTTAHDEINLLMPGHDYGNPNHRGLVDREGITPPLLDYASDRVAPTGITYYDGARFPALRGAFLMCHNHGPGLFALRVETAGPARLTAMTQIAKECAVDVVAAPDGNVYFNDATAIYRLAS